VIITADEHDHRPERLIHPKPVDEPFLALIMGGGIDSSGRWAVRYDRWLLWTSVHHERP